MSIFNKEEKIKMYKYKKSNFIIISFMILISLISSFHIKNTYAAVPEGVQAAVGGDTVTMYYLKLPVKDIPLITYDEGLAAAISPNTTWRWNVFEDAAALTNNRVHTFIFTYNNITINGSALLTTWNIECTVTGWGNFFGGHLTFYPKDDININIRSEYYELFQSGDFSEVTITYMYQANGYRMVYDGNINSYIYDLSGASLHTREVAPDYDPIEEEGQAPDNGGVAVDPALPGTSWVDDIIDGITSGTTLLFTAITLIVAVILILRFVKPKNG